MSRVRGEYGEIEQMIKQLVVYKIHAQGFRALDLETKKIYSTKGRYPYDIKEFESVEFEVIKEWRFSNTDYLQGKVLSHHYNLLALSLPSHNFSFSGNKDFSYLNNEKEYGPQETLHGLYKSYCFDKYSCFSGDDIDNDPILRAIEADTYETQYDILCKVWEEHPSCIDALVHLGHMHFELGELGSAHRFYEVALRIAEKNIPKNFEGIFPYSRLENRPYHRALHGMCLTLWRQECFDEALKIAQKGLALNPMDNIGFRFLLTPLKEKEEWEEEP